MNVNVQTITGNVTLVAGDFAVFVDASTTNITITLPAANVVGPGAGDVYNIKRLDTSTNTVTISPVGTDKIDNLLSAQVRPHKSTTLCSDGSSKWWTF